MSIKLHGVSALARKAAKAGQSTAISKEEEQKYQSELNDALVRLQSQPENIDLVSRAAELYRLLGNDSQAVYYFERVATHFGEQGDFAKASEIYNILLEMEPEHHTYREKCIKLLMQLRKQKSNAPRREQLSREATLHLRILADHAQRDNNMQGALKCYRAIAELDPDDLENCWHLVRGLVSQDKVDSAVRHLKKTARMLIRKRHFEDAQACLVEATLHDEGNPDLKALYFRLQIAEGFGDVGIEGLLALQKKHPNNLEIIQTLGHYYLLADRPLEARNWLLRGYQLDLRQVGPLRDVGLRLIANGNHLAAYEAFEPVAGQMVRQGQAEQAVALFLQVYRLDRTHVPTLVKLFELYIHLGNHEAAAKAANRLMGAYIHHGRRAEGIEFFGGLLSQDSLGEHVRRQVESLVMRYAQSGEWSLQDFTSSLPDTDSQNQETFLSLPDQEEFVTRLAQAMKFAIAGNHHTALIYLGLDQESASVVGKCKAVLQNTDTLTILESGEIAILLPEIKGPEVILEIIKKLRELITAEVPEQSFWFGVTHFPEHGQDESDLMKQAEASLQAAREEASGSIVLFNDEIASESLRAHRLERDLGGSLSKHELELHFQPIIDLIGDGGMVGMEALIRWRHPVLGLLLPGEFLGLATQNGLLPKIGNWVLHRAVEQIRRWHHDGFETPWISLNVNREQCEDESFRAGLTKVMSNHALPEGVLKLCFEGQEDLMCDTSPENRTWLQGLREMGITLTVDNFGTGSTSAIQLMRSPVASVKINRGFTAGMIDEPETEEVVKTILEMAEKLKIKAVAEGIETAEQLAYLKQAGCHYGQGHFLSKPLPAEQLRPLLTKKVASSMNRSYTYTKSFRKNAG